MGSCAVVYGAIVYRTPEHVHNNLGREWTETGLPQLEGIVLTLAEFRGAEFVASALQLHDEDLADARRLHPIRQTRRRHNKRTGQVGQQSQADVVVSFSVIPEQFADYGPRWRGST